MRWILFAALSLAMSCVGLAQGVGPLCALDPARMPERWRPPDGLQKVLKPAPWSRTEAVDAKSAIASGMDEIVGYFQHNPDAVQKMWDDSIEALVQVTHSSANKPELDAKLLDAARSNLAALITPYLDLDPAWAICDELDTLLPLAIFAHRLNSAKNKLTQVITKRTNAAYRACGSLAAAADIDIRGILASKGAPPGQLEDLFDLYLWDVWLIEAELYPSIELRAEDRKLGREIWTYFQAYRLAGASTFEDGARDETFQKTARLAARIAYIPTGAHRFPLYVADKPDLYRFFRENFYPVLKVGELEDVALFVDALRQYGCTAENDMQVRDGSRYLLRLFHDSNDRWMDYRPAGERDDTRDYDRIQFPWKAALALRVRRPEQPKPGTYGGIVRRWLPPPPQRN